MSSEDFEQGRIDGRREFSKPKPAEILAPYSMPYRVGYVLGVCSQFDIPNLEWGVLAGAKAAELDGPLHQLLPHLRTEARPSFIESYQVTMRKILSEEEE